MEIHYKIIGFLLIALSCIHVVFPKYFHWKKDLDSLSLINREMMYVHTFFVAIMVFLMGVLCITSSKELIETDLGKNIALGMCIFWTIRLLIQFFGYSAALWKGKTFETIMHILFSLLWIYLSIIFGATYFNH